MHTLIHTYYIRICICICVCVCIYIYLYLYLICLFIPPNSFFRDKDLHCMCILLHFCVLPVCTFSVCAVHLLVHVSVLCVIYLYVLKSSTLRRFVCLLPSQLCAYSRYLPDSFACCLLAFVPLVCSIDQADSQEFG